MALFERLIGRGLGETGKLPIHPFVAMLREWAEGNATRNQVIALFGLASDDLADLDWLATKYGDATDKEAWFNYIHRWLLLAEWGHNVAALDRTWFAGKVNGLS